MRSRVKSKKIGALLLLVVLTTLVGCSTHNRTYAFRFHENAKQKPIVAVLPLVCKIPNHLSWSLSEEITQEVKKRLDSRSEIYLNQMEISSELKQKLEQRDIISVTASDIKAYRQNNEFVVLMELIDHSERFYSRPGIKLTNENKNTDARLLSMQVRVKVYDVRAYEPKIVLQEILKCSHIIPKESDLSIYNELSWGTDGYSSSPYGRAHAKLERDLAFQIEKYISIAK